MAGAAAGNGAPVLVTGATGQIGYGVLRALAAARRPAVALSRQGRPTWAAGWTSLQWRQVRDRVRAGGRAAAAPDLIHAAPLELAPAVLAATPGLQRVVAFSSTSVLSKGASPDAAERAVVGRLVAGERAFQAACERHGVTGILLRPTLVYGYGLDRNLTRIAVWLRRWPVFPLAHGGRGLRQPLHAGDLAATALGALQRPGVAGVYSVAGGTTLSYRDMVAAVFRSLGRRPRFMPLPAPLLGLAARWAGVRPAMIARMGEDLVFDDSPAREALGHAPGPFAPDAGCWRAPA